jgi:acetyl-CoA acetyltransferase
MTKRALNERDIPLECFDALHLGTTIPSPNSFYGAAWLAGMIGMPEIAGPTINQACATSTRLLAGAAYELQTDKERCILTVAADKTSNGPHIYYPNPAGPGGQGGSEDWVGDNFNCDPYAMNAMIDTAENVARDAGISKEEQDAATVTRYQQYNDALKDNAAFHKSYMLSPVEVKDASGRKTLATVQDDEGIFPTTPEGLARLRPVKPDGTVTFGTQTHPADGNSGMVVTSRQKATELAGDKSIEVQLLSFGQSRARKGFMAQAPVPAARMALDAAGLKLADIKAIKTHNPFAVNDIYFAREMGINLENFNHFGSSLVFGHPQGPTGMRLVMELIEELVLRGGGYGLFTGCAAGDTGAALILRVDNA